MTTTSPVGGSAVNINAALQGSTANAADLQKNFLTMLVTQMNNQDPLNPMDNAQLTSQLAQISTVSGLQTMNATLSQLLDQVSASRAMDSAALIGHTVMVPGAQVSVRDGVAGGFGVDLPSTAEGLTVEILDAQGNVVRSMEAPGRSAGVHDLAWDGKDGNGNAVPDGDYAFRVTATANGQVLKSTALTYGKVQAVSGDANGVLLDIGNGNRANVDDVRRIS